MRRLLTVLLAAAALLAGACGDDGSSDGGDGLATTEPGTLTVCSSIPYAPFEYEEEGEVVGIDADLLREIGRRLDLDVTFRNTDFDGIFAALKARQCDVIGSAVTITDERKKNNDFTDGYYEINQSLLVRADDADRYSDLAALQGRTIGVQSETTGAAYAEANASGSTIKEFTGADDLFLALKSGQVDAVLQDFPVNSYHAETTGETVVVQEFAGDEKEVYGFVVRPGSDALLEALNDALADMREDGTYDKVLARYVGEAGAG